MTKNNDSEKHKHDEQLSEHVETAETVVNINKLSEKSMGVIALECPSSYISSNISRKIVLSCGNARQRNN